MNVRDQTRGTVLTSFV